MKSFIVGYYGFENVGDERLLNRTAVILKDSDPESKICVLHASHAYQDIFKNKPFHTSQLLGEWTYCRRRSFVRILGALWSSDQVVFGGGGLLQDATSFRSLAYYLGFIFLAGLFNKKVVLLGQGVGPLKRRGSRWWTRKALKYVTKASVRDSKSYDLMLKLGMPKENLALTADLAYYRSKGIQEQKNEHSKPPLIGLSLRKSQAKEPFIAELSKSLLACPQDFLFLDFNLREDFKALQALPELSARVIDTVMMNKMFDNPSSASALDTYRLDSVVAMRYHACVWASLNGIPFLALAYDEKVTSLAEELGQEWILPSEFTQALFERKLGLIQVNLEHYKRALTIGVERHIQRSKHNLESFEL